MAGPIQEIQPPCGGNSDHPAARPPRKRFTFGRERRIRKRPEFMSVYQTGRKIEGRFAMLFAKPRPPGPEGKPLLWRLGITSTRKSGNSVSRNRQRRLTREYFRLNQAWIPEGWDFVVNTRGSLAKAGYARLAEDLDRTLGRLGFQRPPEQNAMEQKVDEP